MKANTINAIHEATLDARKLLFSEVSDQLEGIYGFLPNGTFKESALYPALSSNPEAEETRRRIERLISDESKADLSIERSREKLIQEVAFTWLNRLVAFKMLEVRKHLRQTITKSQESNGFKMWLTEAGNEERLHDFESGDLPQNGLGEGPRQRAYRNFLLAQCAVLASEIRVLFDPDNIASRLCPRPPVLKSLIELLNRTELKEAWEAGNEDAIGWVYQFFIEDQKKDVFNRLYKKKQKIRPEDIPAATQIFTPRWIVRFLVENTLGRMWIQMHPDSQLKDRLSYLVHTSAERPTVALKPAKEIRILDPACGTMHFGLVAFDLLAEMYKEELERKGLPGWLDQPSVETEEEIATTILAENIHGIDIDLRAVQLSALSLFIRAKASNSSAKIIDSRLACADIHMTNGDRLKEFLQSSSLGQTPIYATILQTMHQRLKHSNQLGSLLRVNEDVKKFILDERTKFEGTNKQLSIFGSKDGESNELGRDFWDQLENRIVDALNDFADVQNKDGSDQGFFAAETSKGIRLLDIMGQTYDVVITNPPYMTLRNMNAVLKDHLEKEYENAKGDLYSAFIQRCTEWLKRDGRLGMITQQSFMFITTYEKFREFLRRQVAIETVLHLGPRAFDEVSGEKVNTVAFVVRKESAETIREASVGTYVRLLKEPDGDSKRHRFEQSVTHLQESTRDSVVYQYKQCDFDAIPGSPWVYWITDGLRSIFRNFPQLVEVARPRVGLQSSDNFRFLRFWWEVGKARIGFGCSSREECESRPEKWYPHMKGGSVHRWYGHQEYVINYGSNGLEIKAWADPLYDNSGWSRIIKCTEYYFKTGITFPKVGSGRFSARISPPGFIFDVAGSSVFPENLPLILSVMNSRFAAYALRLINPTVNTQVGDIARLPVPQNSHVAIDGLVETAIELARADAQTDDRTFDFISPPSWQTGLEGGALRLQNLSKVETEINDEICNLFGISKEDREAMDMELSELITDEENEIEELTQPEDPQSEIEPQLTRDKLARRWISYAFGIVVGRFEVGRENVVGRGNFESDIVAKLRAQADPDGIMVLDESHPDDLPSKIIQTLQIAVGEDATRQIIVEGIGKGVELKDVLRDYFRGQFFKEHLQAYRKRPVYWLLQSPRKKYSVWVFHEKLSSDSLYRIRGEQYLGSKINLLETELAELRKKRDSLDTKARRQIEKRIESVEEILADLHEFAKRIDAIAERGYIPRINDGVLINMSPLWELIPGFQVDLKKCWDGLENGNYDWSQQALDHWPERVREKCKSNKSYAIAHGINCVLTRTSCT